MKNSNQSSNPQQNKLTEFSMKVANLIFITGFSLIALFSYTGWENLPVFVKNGFIGIYIAYVAAFKVRKFRWNGKNTEHMFMFWTLVFSAVIAILGVLPLNKTFAYWCVIFSRGIVAITYVYALVVWFKTKRSPLDFWDVIISVLAIIQTYNIIQ